MSIKLKGKKTNSYYNFLAGIGEENLPLFSKEQINLIDSISGMLPLVRPHEYRIIQCLLQGISTYDAIENELAQSIPGFTGEQLAHALKFMQILKQNDQTFSLNVTINDSLREYLDDLIGYGLSRYDAEFGEETGFKLWHNYRKDQVQLKLLKHPKSKLVGTYYYDDYVVIFASLKKDLPAEDRLNYKDQFLDIRTFQWESKNNLANTDLDKLNRSHYVHLFIRKVADENGITLPFTYVGKGHLRNCRKVENENGTYLFDIALENELPDYLQYDFGLMI